MPPNFSSSAQPLDDGDVRGPATLTHGLESVPSINAVQLVQHRGEQLGASGPKRVAQCDSTTVGIDPGGSAPVSINQLRTTEANASFISTVSIWPIAMPDFASAYFVAGIGAESCSIGSSPRTLI